jgi:hypothetical protein
MTKYEFYVIWRKFYGKTDKGFDIIGGCRSKIKSVKAKSYDKAIDKIKSCYWAKDKKIENISLIKIK